MKRTTRSLTTALACACGVVHAAAADGPPKYVESQLLQDEVTTEK
jgi:hypothetical protein